MKSNLIVITVAAALITTTVTIIHPPYSSLFSLSYLASCGVNWT